LFCDRSSSSAQTNPAARELIEREQPEGVAHDYADSGAGESFLIHMPKPSKHHREGCKPQVRFRLAAARWKKEQVHGFVVWISRIRDSRQVQQNKSQLERTPLWRVDPQSLLQRASDSTVCDTKRVERIRLR
jgi:hypothetical protein